MRYSKRAGHSSNKRGDLTSSQTNPKLGEIAGKRRKRYVYFTTGELTTCIIHGPGYYYDECKVLRYFGAKYAKYNPTKDHVNNNVPRKIINIKKENNAIVNNVVDEI